MTLFEDVITAVRTRAAAADIADITLTTNPSINERDGLPQVMVFMADPGDATTQTNPIHLKELTLVCDVRFKFDTDWLLEGAVIAEKMQDAVFLGPVPDTGDRLGVNGVREIEHIKNIISPESDSRLGSAQVHIKIKY